MPSFAVILSRSLRSHSLLFFMFEWPLIIVIIIIASDILLSPRLSPSLLCFSESS